MVGIIAGITLLCGCVFVVLRWKWIKFIPRRNTRKNASSSSPSPQEQLTESVTSSSGKLVQSIALSELPREIVAANIPEQPNVKVEKN